MRHTGHLYDDGEIACRVCGDLWTSDHSPQARACPGMLDIEANIAALRDVFRWAKRENRPTVMEDCAAAHKTAATVPWLIAIGREHKRRMVIFREQNAADYAAWEVAIKASPTGRAEPPQCTAVPPGAPA